MAISTSPATIISPEDTASLATFVTTPVRSSTVLTEPTATSVFNTTTARTAAVNLSASARTGSLEVSTSANRSVLIAGIDTTSTSTAIVDSVSVYNTSKDIYVTGIDLGTTQQFVYNSNVVKFTPATSSELGGVIIGDGLTVNNLGIVNLDLPIASTTVLGGVRVDGTSIVINPITGVISATGGGFEGGYNLPIAGVAPDGNLGGVKVGSGLAIDSETGVLSALPSDVEYQISIAQVTAKDTEINFLKVPDNTVQKVRLNGGTAIELIKNDDMAVTINNKGVTQLIAGEGVTLSSASNDGKGDVTISVSALTSGTVTSVNASGGTTGLTFTGGPITESGTLLMSGTLIASNGGTGQSSYTTGDILFASNSSTLVKRAIGTEGQVLTVNASGVPVWSDPSAGNGTGTVTSVNVSGGTTGISFSGGPITESGTILMSGTLIASNGGTGQSSYTTGDILFASNSSTLVKRAIGTEGQVLTVNASGVPVWSNPASGGTGTVTSVAASGGTTGLTFSGTPITTSGTLTLGGILAVANGGTGASTQAGALTNLLPTKVANSYLHTDGANITWKSIGTYTIASTFAANGANIRLSGSDSSIDDVTFVNGDFISVTSTDENTITISASIPQASTAQAGIVKVDGVTITIDANGTISAPGGGGAGGSGTVTSVSFTDANGFTGTVATNTTTPNLTIGTSVTGLLKGNGTGVSAAVSGTDFAPATSGTSILSGNGSGGFSSVTIGTGLSFSGGTLSATAGVTGPASSTDNAITRFNGTTGQLIQNSLVTISDTGAITAPSVGSVIPFYYASQTNFPSATTYAGAVAVSDEDGKMYFAHNGSWVAVANGSGAGGSGITLSDISVVDNGGDGSLNYNNATGVFTYTGPSASDVRAHFSAGTGITITNGVIASSITQYSLPTASASVLGGVKVGSGLSIDASGVLSATASSGTVTSVGISSSDLSVSGTPVTTSGTISLSLNTVGVAKGGTGQTSYSTGDILYASSSSALTKLAIGSEGQVLTVNGSGVPTWAPASTASSLTYSISAASVTGGVNLTLTGSDTTSSTVRLSQGSNISITQSGGVVTIASTASGGGGTSTPEIVVFKYTTGSGGNLSGSDSIVSVTSGVTATVSDGANAIVNYTFSGKTNPPKSVTAYGQVCAANGSVQRFIIKDVTSFAQASLDGGTTLASPEFVANIATSVFNSTVTLQTRMSDVGASAGLGQRAHLVVVFGF